MKKEKILIISMIMLLIIIIAIIITIYVINNKRAEEDDIRNLQEGGAEFTEAELNNFEFEIINMNKEIKNKINNYDKFYNNMKEYIYKNGLIQANTATYIDTEDNNGTIIKFRLNDANKTILKAQINNNIYNFSDDY